MWVDLNGQRHEQPVSPLEPDQFSADACLSKGMDPNLWPILFIPKVQVDNKATTTTYV